MDAHGRVIIYRSRTMVDTPHLRAILMGDEFGLTKIGLLGQKLCTLVGLVGIQFGCSWLSYHLLIQNDGRYTTADASTCFDRAILMGDEFGLT